VRNSGSDFASAVYVAGGWASISRVRMDHNRHGLVVDSGTVTIRDSIASHQIMHAVWARGHTASIDLMIENCTITGTELGSGIIAGDPDPSSRAAIVHMFVSNSTVTGNATGIATFLAQDFEIFGAIWVSNTTIAFNQKGIVHGPPEGIIPPLIRDGGVRSRVNNTLEGNGDNGTFTATFAVK